MKQHAFLLMACAAVLVLTMTACVAERPAQPGEQPVGAASTQDNIISQIRQGAITIDGALGEWAAGEWVAVDKFVSGGVMTPSPDLDVKASFAFDAEKFYLAVRALDDDIQTVDRSWRYGDGFLFTLVTDEGKDRSSYVYQYAFDQESKGLLFKNGEYLLHPVEDVEFEFREHGDGVDYEVAIPFKLLKPFNPFTYQTVALNLIYTDRDGGSEGTPVMIRSDADYDTERSTMRAGEFFALKTVNPRTAQDASYHAALAKNFFRDGETIEVHYAVNAAKRQGGATIRAAILREGAEQQVEKTLDLQPGLSGGTLSLAIGDLPSGNYTVRVTFLDQNGNPVSAYADDVFVLNQGEIERARKRVSAFRAQEALQASLSNLEIRFDWFDEFYKRPNYEDISALNDWWGDIVTLNSRLERRESAVFDKGTVKRYAHRSKIDNTLQPYSVFLPESFSADTRYPLVVVLHGSGVDEQDLIKGLAGAAGILGYPMIAPKARGLSDFYVGDSGEDVFECIEHFVGLYPNIRQDRIFLLGFSMGGYGTWRLGILRPDYFRGLIVMSGTVRPDTLQGVDALRDQNIFVVHGAQDSTVSVDGARQVVEKLKAMNANVVYIEIPEGGHDGGGSYDPTAEIIAWIKKYSS